MVINHVLAWLVAFGIPVRTFISKRLTLTLLAAGMCALALPQWVSAQEDANDTPLGDVARSFRRKTAPPEVVIDNDNFSQVVDDAESRRAAGSTMVFSLEPAGKSFQVSSPDVSCSLSFSAKTSSLLNDPILLDDLPRSELAKLDGPAMIDGDSLQVTMHNGTAWELREVVIGLTIVRRPEPGDAASFYGLARIVPAVAGGTSYPAQDSFQKQPDVTVLLKVKGSAAPAATALFRTPLNFALFPDQEWHWAIVRAKGVPPQTPPEEMTMQSEPGPGPLPATPPEAGTQSLPLIPAPSPLPSNPDLAIH
ncbi:MAG: hypothetical protein WCA49_22890 [Candidatus Sulfotelmatobacter sp.]